MSELASEPDNTAAPRAGGPDGGNHPGALVFDFDGTLFHLPVDFAAVRRELGLAPDARIGDALQRFLDEDDRAGLDVVTRHEVESVAAGEFTEGAPELLDRLRGRRDLAILTRNSREAVLAALGSRADGLLVVGREDVRRLKPDPEGARLIMSRFGVRPEQCALVGDTYHDVQAARAAGMRSIVVRNPRLAYAPEGADVYLDTLLAL